MKFIEEKFITDNVFFVLKNSTHIIVYCAKHKPFDIWSGYIHKIFSDFQESEYITTDKKDESTHICFTITYKHYPSRNVDKNGNPYMNTTIIDWEFMEED
jgi:hypothetical protein